MLKQPISYNDIIDRFSSKKILVIGDLILDVYIKGVSTRLSPEAPVPVVDVSEKITVLGGAANTACNLKALSAQVSFCSALGTDAAAEEAIQLLKMWDIDVSGILKHSERATLVKTRVMAGERVLVRYDEGTEHPVNELIEQTLSDVLEESYDSYDAILISDYNKGMLTENMIAVVQRLQRRYQKFLVVDSKRLEFFSTLKPDLVKPNYEEVIKLLNAPHQYSGRPEQIPHLAGDLFDKTQAHYTTVTMDAEGSLVFRENQLVHRSFAPFSASPNVAGAGDTYISAFTLGYISADDIPAAAELATAAASIAVNKAQTSVCFKRELRCYFSQQQKCIYSLERLEETCAAYRVNGKRVVFTNGCFDILHSGHVSYLNQARDMGDVLIVGVNTDESIRRLKGERRPINPLEDRLQVLAGLAAVTHVVPFGDVNDDTPIELIKAVKPTVFVKGGDYTRDKLPEADTVDEVGGEIVFIPLIPDQSTTRIIDRIHEPSLAG
jgi:D-beta-D-heptose 7-phosphate kinase / D-beta-D-heptose 1-phosphate adenosyltransferase